MKRRFELVAMLCSKTAWAKVPEPAKGSKIISPSLDPNKTKSFNKSRGLGLSKIFFPNINYII